MNLAFKYTSFCIIAILANLFTQRIFLDSNYIKLEYIYVLVIGTIVGLITKYFLDKNYIFHDHYNSLRYSLRKFSLYTFNGVFTTIIFWSAESLAFYIYATTFARELGAIIGLSVGYLLKYRLDKKLVFPNIS
mgnify:CR=1 FL=1